MHGSATPNLQKKARRAYINLTLLNMYFVLILFQKKIV